MLHISTVLFLSLLVILLAAELFTNALEHLGERLGISEGVTGSIFAAVGTALPETAVPLLSLAGGAGHTGTHQEIAVGAILGAPLMLSTLSLFIMGVAASRRGICARLSPETSGFRRDLNCFIVAYLIAGSVMFLPPAMHHLRVAAGLLLIAIYVGYILRTMKASALLVQDGHATEADHQLFLSRLGLPVTLAVIVLQLLVALGLLIGGARGFIAGVEEASAVFGVPALLLSLVVVPIATELPEKINSVLWVRRGKDTLAIGNITGAMTFQGTLLPAIGITLTPWTSQPQVLIGVVITLLSALWLRLLAGRLRVIHLILNGILYAVYLSLCL